LSFREQLARASRLVRHLRIEPQAMSPLEQLRGISGITGCDRRSTAGVGSVRGERRGAEGLRGLVELAGGRPRSVGIAARKRDFDTRREKRRPRKRVQSGILECVVDRFRRGGDLAARELDKRHPRPRIDTQLVRAQERLLGTIAKAFRGGWFHSGDLAVWHPDGNVELRDRGKDIIISGGENISSIEVEQTIVAHPAVLECAVVAIPHEHWGERPKAFVTLRDEAVATGAEIIAFARDRLAHYKCPDAIEFGELPKTSTGKVQKYVLREREWAGRETRIGAA
jgi:acyl-CoA synthetase (AMP-forming)/AMP-acid ligase II